MSRFASARLGEHEAGGPHVPVNNACGGGHVEQHFPDNQAERADADTTVEMIVRTIVTFLVTLLAATFVGSVAGAGSSTSIDASLKPLARIAKGADPTAIVLPDGRIRLYWAAGAGKASAVSSDGISFVREPGTRITTDISGPHTRIMRTPDGGYRLFFNTPPGEQPAGIRSAVSPDGLNFEVEDGFRITAAAAGVAPKGLSTGDVVRLPDGRYRMYFSSFATGERPVSKTHEVVMSAVSSDLLAWKLERGIRVGRGSRLTGSAEHPSALRLRNGSIALFYGRPWPHGVFMSVSKNGLLFTHEALVVKKSLDSTVVARRNGTLLVYYGLSDPPIGRNGGSVHVGKLILRRAAQPPRR